MKKLIWFLIISGSIFLILFYINSSKISRITQISPITPTPATSSQPFTTAKVIKVIDGDTIQIEGGQKVRYIGMDTTELYPKVECYSKEAKAENEKLVFEKTVRLEKDVSETDKYGRLLRYVYLDKKMINEELVKDGAAKVMSVPPDIKYKNTFLEMAKYARENKLGLWGNCKII